MNVYSFVATQQVSAFSGNLMEFFQYVKLNTNQYLIKVECGTEPFVGTNVTLKVSHYSATIIIIWLTAIGGALPIGANRDQKLTTATIAGYQWHYYVGKNGDMNVYYFVATQQVSTFRGNLMEFFQYVKLNTNQYLIKVECGTEPFVGTNVTLKVSHYSAAIVTA
ncbi:hypothetical protein KXD40_000377 [Peronospora effusa]|nr:hypothetical protein KXD40_000377 [Peronospora effusa]